jgi:predicted membrane protein
MGSSRATSYVWAVIVILIGIVLLLNNLGVTAIDLGVLISTYWPVLLLIWGINILAHSQRRRNTGSIIAGFIILVLGLAFLGRNLGYFSFDFSVLWGLFWPLFLIIAGINIFRAHTRTEGTSWAIMSGIERKNRGWKLDNKSYVAIMGGIDLDLTQAEIPDKEIILDFTAIMGGIDVKAPEDIPIICKGTAILGGISFFNDEGGGIFANREFEFEGDSTSKKRIIIYCRTLMGGIDIKKKKA